MKIKKEGRGERRREKEGKKEGKEEEEGREGGREGERAGKGGGKERWRQEESQVLRPTEHWVSAGRTAETQWKAQHHTLSRSLQVTPDGRDLLSSSAPSAHLPLGATGVSPQ